MTTRSGSGSGGATGSDARAPAPDTLAAQAGRDRPPVAEAPAAPPIYQTSVFEFDALDRMAEVEASHGQGPPHAFSYTREGNPTVATFERAVAGLEGAADAWAAASGMGAIFTALWTLLGPGDHVVLPSEVYGGTYRAVTEDLARAGVRSTLLDEFTPEAVRHALEPSTRVVYAETISNPTMRVPDLPTLAATVAAHRSQATARAAAGATPCLLVVDNTFASPILCRPLALGADLVVESATKFLGGHSDVSLGVVAGSTPLVAAIRRRGMVLGPTADPFSAWLSLRGLKTLALRVRRQCDNALELARRLSSHPAVGRVHYPGVGEGRPGRAAAVLSGGYGAMLAFTLRANGEDAMPAARRFIRALRLVRLVPSLGDVATSVSHPVSSSHRAVPADRRRRLGIDDALIRVSVGAEAVDDIWDDFDRALRAIQ